MAQALARIHALGNEPGADGIIFKDHDQCLALSGVFRGKLCEQLVRALPRLRIAAGTPVYSPHEPSRNIYFLASGLVKSSVLSDAGRELILQVHKKGDIFGNFCFCNVGQLDQAVALQDSEVVEIRFDRFISHIQKNRPAMLDFLATIGDRLADAYRQLSILSFDRRMERLVLTLLKLAEDLGVAGPDGIKIAHYFTQEELAEMIAGRREVVSELLNQLRKMDLVRYSRKQRLTINKKGLQDYLRSIRARKE